ncbi:hypothetical protein [Gimesia maris]|uniref:Uncharacterized protein n=1 Tax=Gimesia maris TaxID=122 RepID=A0A3D3RG84_9PLAN|nr:hypothetical protein [Gimesia sp.]HCO27088.1 hypothetical protein [Gimesia maris]|tara:strand:- start:165801 stop:166085 length:285 start_codon:yes stop_codon:yes gene_type:complete
MSKGYFIVLGGILAFFGLIAIATLLPINFENKLPFAQLSFFIMAAGFIVGSIVIAVDKGYSGILGFFFGLFSPLGLLILTLLPDRSVKNVETAE